MAGNAETGAHGGGEQAHAGGGADEREGIERNLDAAGIRTAVNHNIYAVVLHCGIEVLFHNGIETVNFVNKKHVAGIEVGEQSCQIAGFFDDRTGRHFEAGA